MGYGRTNFDHGAERSQKGDIGQRQEVGQRGFDAPAPRREVMAELVDREDKEQGRGEGDALNEVDQRLDAAQGIDALLHGAGGGHR